ncbi:MAG TPA: DUF4296 domain-containing protein [Flavobacterium sp.]|nr:DUF4296 domain-containing protein [Flavobacterium sp.]
MKNILFVLGVALVFASCKNEVMTKPKNLIEQDKMVAIIYDLAILEAMRSQPQQPGESNNIVNPKAYIFKKYQIDSLQFAQSNHYYASDIGNYKKMYDEVKTRIETQQKQIDGVVNKAHGTPPPGATGTDPDAPQIQ